MPVFSDFNTGINTAQICGGIRYTGIPVLEALVPSPVHSCDFFIACPGITMQQWKYVYWWVRISLVIVKAGSFVAPATSVKIAIFLLQ